MMGHQLAETIRKDNPQLPLIFITGQWMLGRRTLWLPRALLDRTISKSDFRSLTAKLPGDRWQRLAGLRGLLGYMWAFPGKQLLFMGSELADEQEWSEHRGLDWSALHDPGACGVRDLLRDLNARYREGSELWSQDTSANGFQWIAYDDWQNNVLSFLRWGSDGAVLACVSNFSGMSRRGYRIGLPKAGRWVEVLNTDAAAYGGSGEGNLGAVTAAEEPSHGYPASAEVTVGPLATVWFRLA